MADEGFPKIPEFFYDVYSRFLPGLLALLVLPLAFDKTPVEILVQVLMPVDGLKSEATQAIVSAFFAVVSLVTAFLVGFALSAPADFLESWLSRRSLVLLEIVNKSPAAEQHYSRRDIETLRSAVEARLQPEHVAAADRRDLTSQLRSVLFTWHDVIRAQSPERGERLAKLRAMYRMSIGLTIVSAGIALTHVLAASRLGPVVTGASRVDLSVPFLLLCAGMTMAFWLGARRYFVTFQYAVLNSQVAASQPPAAQGAPLSDASPGSPQTPAMIPQQDVVAEAPFGVAEARAELEPARGRGPT